MAVNRFKRAIRFEHEDKFPPIRVNASVFAHGKSRKQFAIAGHRCPVFAGSFHVVRCVSSLTYLRYC